MLHAPPRLCHDRPGAGPPSLVVWGAMARPSVEAGDTGDASRARDVRRLALYVVPAVLATLPGLVMRFAGVRTTPALDAVIFGIAMLAAGFMLTWGAETAEQDVSQGLVLAVLALVTVLPEYVVDIYFAYQAGKEPGGQYVEFATANMTGANRLLIGVAWPLIALLYWARGGGPVVRLSQGNAAEVAFLALATVYSFVIYLKGSITIVDTVVLVGLFGAYLWRQSGQEEAGGGADKKGEAVGPPAVLLRLPNRPQWAAIVAFTVFAGAVILSVAEPFAESLVDAGADLGINQFLLIQWLAPIASEAPAVIIAVLFVLRLRASGALGTLVSDKINQWTLLVGMIPLFYVLGAGRLTAFPLSDRQREEFFLTAAQSVFGVAVLLRLRLSLRGALMLLVLFLVQFGIGFVLRNDNTRTIRVLTGMAWLYLALSAGLILWNRAHLIRLFAAGLFNRLMPGAKSETEAEP